MPQVVALADEEVRRVVRALSADVQASLALSRAMLQAVAALSPAVGAAAEDALTLELSAARRAAAPQRVLDLLEDTRARLAAAPLKEAMARDLEAALVAAAAALPDVEEPVRVYR